MGNGRGKDHHGAAVQGKKKKKKKKKKNSPFPSQVVREGDGKGSGYSAQSLVRRKH